MKPVKLDDRKTEALLAELLPGENPTPPRVRTLLAELAERRKGSPVDLHEQERAAAQAAGITLPDAPPTPEIPPPSPMVDVDPPDNGTIPDDDQSEIINAAKDSFRAFDEKRRKAILARPVSTLRRATRIETLTEAAHILLAELDAQQRDRVLEISQENSWPPWVVVLGAVARSADLQELLTGDFKEDWLSRPERSEHAAPAGAKCEVCGGTIPDARRGQRFCCSAHGSEKTWHSEGCALSYLTKTDAGSWIDTRR